MQSSVITDIKKMILEKKIVSISGESGTGKTTLACQIATFLMLDTTPYHYQCLWVQASEYFPKKRLAIMFSKKDKEFQYITKNIFVIPGTTIQTYQEQYDILTKFEKKNLPPDIKIIVIDNISHHLRYEISQRKDISKISTIKNRFYDELLFPLIMYCQREEIILLLLHEVSADVESGTIKPFFANLYQRIDGVSISLSKHQINGGLTMKVTNTDKRYKIVNEGLIPI
ncbi:MAG: hypothetical protein ACFE8J_09095 [Candidatus Heimdallarchaeota archaeon]